jgi:hypothetical protein
MSLKYEQGQALIYALIFLIVGSLLVASLVPFLGAGFRRQLASQEHVMAGYAAEAGIKRVIAVLIRGADALSPHYPIPVITLNKHTPTIDVRPAIIAPPSEVAYIDPGVRNPALKVVPAGQGYLMRLHHVKESELRVNWAYSPAGLTKLGIWKGLTAQAAGRIYDWPEEYLIAMAESIGDYNYVSVDITHPGIYTIVFFNDAGTKVTTRSFGQGGSMNTWIYLRAHQDYVITVAVGEVSVSAFVRQIPGFSEPLTADRSSWITNEVSILSWRAP